MSYHLHVTGLEERVAKATLSPRHEHLLAHMCVAHPRLAASTLAVSRDGAWHARRKVLDTAGRVVHDDHRVFLAQELQSRTAPEVLGRLTGLDYRLSECGLTTLYVVSDNGGAQDNFVQAVILVEDEFVDRRMFSRSARWREPQDLFDLCNAATDGERFEGARRQRIRPSAYRLASVVDVAAFVRAASAVDSERRGKAAGRVSSVTNVDLDITLGGRLTWDLTLAEIDPDLMKYAWRGRRMFDDWAASSAGRSGARLCEQWILETSDYTDPTTGERSLEFMPAWTFARKVAEIGRVPGSVYELFGKLESIDRRVGVPFAWFFWMLHGNKVHSWAASQVIAGAEAGLLVLPEHDYRVLKRWDARYYSF